jgi:hypothetical protein
MASFFVVTSAFNARYCFRFFARKFYTVAELSDEFSTQFSFQLVKCSLPCKRLVSSEISQLLGGPDNRPIIYAAGEMYINEDICKHFSSKKFAAGLAYEQSHYDSGFYMYSQLIMLIIVVGCMPMVAFLNDILQQLIARDHSWIIVSLLAYGVNLLHRWPLLQVIILVRGIILLEFVLGRLVVNFYVNSGYDLKSLLEYLQYVEGYVTPGLNTTFNVSSNRRYCEKLLKRMSLQE